MKETTAEIGATIYRESLAWVAYALRSKTREEQGRLDEAEADELRMVQLFDDEPNALNAAGYRGAERGRTFLAPLIFCKMPLRQSRKIRLFVIAWASPIIDPAMSREQRGSSTSRLPALVMSRVPGLPSP